MKRQTAQAGETGTSPVKKSRTASVTTDGPSSILNGPGAFPSPEGAPASANPFAGINFKAPVPAAKTTGDVLSHPINVSTRAGTTGGLSIQIPSPSGSVNSNAGGYFPSPKVNAPLPSPSMKNGGFAHPRGMLLPSPGAGSGKSPKVNPFSSVSPKVNPFMSMEGKGDSTWESVSRSRDRSGSDTSQVSQPQEKKAVLEKDAEIKVSKNEIEKKDAPTSDSDSVPQVRTGVPVNTIIDKEEVARSTAFGGVADMSKFSGFGGFLASSTGLSLNAKGDGSTGLAFGLSNPVVGTNTFLEKLAATGPSPMFGGAPPISSSISAASSSSSGSPRDADPGTGGDDDVNNKSDANTDQSKDDEFAEEESSAVFGKTYAMMGGPIITGEEDEDCLVQVRAKLYRLTKREDDSSDNQASAKDQQSEEWKEVGVGPVRILRKHGTSGSSESVDERPTRIVMRREDKKGGQGTKLLINLPLKAYASTTKHGEKAFCLTTFIQLGKCEGNEENDEKEKKAEDSDEVIRANYLIRCKLSQEADQLFESVNKATKAQIKI